MHLIGIAPEKVEFIDGKKVIYYYDTSFDYKLMVKYAKYLLENGFTLLSDQNRTLLFSDSNNNAIAMHAETEVPYLMLY